LLFLLDTDPLLGLRYRKEKVERRRKVGRRHKVHGVGHLD
jgi:hypothetical protein